MSRSHMMVVRRLSSRAGLGRTVVRGWLAWLVVMVGMVVVPAAAEAMPQEQIAAPTTSSHPVGSGARPLICDPRPTEYPGCTASQVRPLLRSQFAREYTGHAPGYRYHRMGQHARGVIFAHLRPVLNARLAHLYAAAVRRYVAQHTSKVVDADGVTHTVVLYPRYRTWAGFRSHTTALCNGTNITVHFPVQYCWSITKLGQAGEVIRSLLYHTARIALSCNGYAIGGYASGTYAAWRMGTGLLMGGYYGAVGVEIGCQTTNLWNWVTHLW